MNKLFSYLTISSVFILVSCATQVKKGQEKASASVKPVAAKKHVHRHRPLPNGTLSLDIVKYQDTLHLLTGTHKDGEKALFYQYSVDQGSSWSNPVNINSTKHIEANFSGGNPARLAINDNNIVAVWAGRKEGVPHNAGPMQASRSSDGGKTWQPSPVPSDWTAGSQAFIAMSGNSNSINAVWLDSRHGKSSVKGSQGLRYSQSTDGGQSWSKNTTLDNITCACCWNTAKFDSSNNYYVLYRDKQPTDMALGVVNPEQKWQRKGPVGEFNWDFPGCPHIGGGLAFQNKDQLMHSIVGTGHMEHLGVHYLRSSDNGKTWTIPVQLGDESAVHGDIAAKEDGRVIAVWDMRTEDGLSIFYAESKDQGLTWLTPIRISKPGMRATHPRIVSNSTGFLALWTESMDGKIQTLQMQTL